MAGSKTKSKRTVAEWEALIGAQATQVSLLEVALGDLLAGPKMREAIEKRAGGSVTVQVKASEFDKGDASVLTATVHRLDSASGGYLILVERWPSPYGGDHHVTVWGYEDWDRSVQQRLRPWSDVMRVLAERLRVAVFEYREGR